MQLGLLNDEDWYKLNESLRAQLQLPNEVQLRTYKGLAHAVYETVVGHAQFLSHKRSVALIKGDSFLPSQIFPWFYREGYNVQAFKRSDTLNLQEWVDSLKKDTVCVVYFEDHPVTGEIFDWQPLDQILNDRKIYGVRISHSSALNTIPIQNYSVRVQPLNSEFAVAALGLKYRSPQVLSGYLPWTGVQVKVDFVEENEQVIRSFESQLPDGYQPLLEKVSRRFDRSLIFHEYLSGEFVLQELAQHLGLKLAEPGLENRLETLNLCRWKNPRLLQDWWDQAPQDEKLQRCLVISADIVKQFGASILKKLVQLPEAGKFQF
jgi:hypothetical protein